MTAIAASFEPVTFTDLPGWADDDHAAAFAAFLRSSRPVQGHIAGLGAKSTPVLNGLAAACAAADRLASAGLVDTAQAKTFFETHFEPQRVCHNGAEGLLTGYYEPEIEGSLEPTTHFSIPVYRRPADLVNLVSDAERGTVGEALTHARKTALGLEPFATRQMIEEGALAGARLELLWLEDPVDCFFMHIQGSGLVRLPDGTGLRITYDGKNGHPYSSVGRALIDAGEFTFEQMSLDALKNWLKADPERGRRAMWLNRSFVFFRPLEGAEAESAMGVMHIPLSTDRSLAVDTSFHAIGSPVYVCSPELRHATETGQSFARLMIAQDVGSAIRGPERGDVYFGSGHAAGARAGITKHPGRFFVLHAKPLAVS